MGSKVLAFLDEALHRKRPGPAEEGAKRQRLLPLYLHLEHGHREAREQLLWKLGDSGAKPAMVARAFCQQFVQQPQQLDREAQRVQKELERQLEQHKDLPSAPPSPTIVKLEVHVTLPHLDSWFYDDPLWDLGAPRAACEAYVSQVCNELGLDWQAHSLITRKMKDAVDAATRDLAAGKAHVVSMPSGSRIVRPADKPGRLPAVMPMSHAQKQQVRQRVEAVLAAKRGEQVPGQQQQQPSPAAQPPAAAQVTDEAGPEGGSGSGGGGTPTATAPSAAAPSAAACQPPAAVAPAPAGPEEAEVGADPTKAEQAASEQTSGQDMPDLPGPDE